MIQIQRVDYNNLHHAKALIYLLNAYAEDPAGGGKPLADEVKENLIERLQTVSGAVSLLAYSGGEPVGLLNALAGFSTFAAKPLINIHDLVVLKTHRGQGIAQQLLDTCETIAKQQGCCKLTLEVLSGNAVAKKSYQQFGFNHYALDESYGVAEFWEKKL